MKNLSRTQISILVLSIVYAFGVLGIVQESFRDTFLMLTPLNLLLTTGMFVWASGRVNTKFIICFAIITISGYLVELAGVHTGVLFGEYTYGPVLGPKLWEVPPMIGINWFLLTFATFGILYHSGWNKYIRMVLAAGLMVFLDFFIEPVAINLDFWTWAGGDIPLQNYVMWMFTAYIMQYVCHLFMEHVNAKVSFFVYLLQLLFFLLLNLLIP